MCTYLTPIILFDFKEPTKLERTAQTLWFTGKIKFKYIIKLEKCRKFSKKIVFLKFQLLWQATLSKLFRKGSNIRN